MSENKNYSPEVLSRQGELSAWGLAVAASLGLYILSLRTAVPYWAWFFIAILFFSACSMSLGNWMDRKTNLLIDNEGVKYQNGLRNALILWKDVIEVRTAPARWGTSVQVIGAKNHFAFSTLGEMQFQGQVKGVTGFRAGQEILDEIIRKGSLVKVVRNGNFFKYSRS